MEKRTTPYIKLKRLLIDLSIFLRWEPKKFSLSELVSSRGLNKEYTRIIVENKFVVSKDLNKRGAKTYEWGEKDITSNDVKNMILEYNESRGRENHKYELASRQNSKLTFKKLCLKLESIIMELEKLNAKIENK